MIADFGSEAYFFQADHVVCLNTRRCVYRVLMDSSGLPRVYDKGASISMLKRCMRNGVVRLLTGGYCSYEELLS